MKCFWFLSLNVSRTFDLLFAHMSFDIAYATSLF